MNKGKKKIGTSKIVMCFMCAMVLQIVIFAEYEMHRCMDLSPLYALIGIVASLAPVIWSYYTKSKSENTKGGIVYDMAMAQMNNTTEETEDKTEESEETFG